MNPKKQKPKTQKAPTTTKKSRAQNDINLHISEARKRKLEGDQKGDAKNAGERSGNRKLHNSPATRKTAVGIPRPDDKAAIKNNQNGAMGRSERKTIC